jgi:hypothetical protein
MAAAGTTTSVVSYYVHVMNNISLVGLLPYTMPDAPDTIGYYRIPCRLYIIGQCVLHLHSIVRSTHLDLEPHIVRSQLLWSGSK